MRRLSGNPKGADGYTIEPCEKDSVGTEIILKIKENTEDDQYDEYLEEYRLKIDHQEILRFHPIPDQDGRERQQA